MLALLLMLTAIPAQPADVFVPIDLDTITFAEAKKLDGRQVLARFTVDLPTFTWFEDERAITVAGPDRGDEIEWVVLLKGERLDVDIGDKLKVKGVIRVIEHPAAVVNGVKVPAWVEVRVSEE